MIEHLRPDDDPNIVAVDGRGRVALGTGAAKLYIRRDEPDGVIVLIPAMVLPASTVAAIDSAIEDPSLAAARSRAGQMGTRRTRPEEAGPGGWYDPETGLMSGGNADWTPPADKAAEDTDD